MKPKDLIGIPWRVAFALQSDGWYLRSDIIWAKPNPMPESVTDRPTKAHEYIFLLSKQDRYYYDHEAIKEDAVGEWTYDQARRLQRVEAGGGALSGGTGDGVSGGTTRNRRTVWNVNTYAFPEAHFATYPPALIEPCIMAGSSEKGCCAECGAPMERMVQKEAKPKGRSEDGLYTAEAYQMPQSATWGKKRNLGGDPRPVETTDWQTPCTCNAATVPCTVIDPFSGAGTTGLTALAKGRNYIGIEINPEYAEMSRRRIQQDAPMFNEVELIHQHEAA